MPHISIISVQSGYLFEVSKKWEFDAWRSLFMDACARRGFHNAVRALPKNRHRSIRDILLKSAPYIDLEPIFLDQWPRVLKKLDFLQM